MLGAPGCSPVSNPLNPPLASSLCLYDWYGKLCIRVEQVLKLVCGWYDVALHFSKFLVHCDNHKLLFSCNNATVCSACLNGTVFVVAHHREQKMSTTVASHTRLSHPHQDSRLGFICLSNDQLLLKLAAWIATKKVCADHLPFCSNCCRKE